MKEDQDSQPKPQSESAPVEQAPSGRTPAGQATSGQGLAAQAPPPPHHLIFIGCMGCGKSNLARLLETQQGWPRLDLDERIIEQAGGKSIPEIFQQEGEARFRERETQALQDLVTLPPHLIATGGGIVLKKENRQLLPTLGYVVWIDATLETLWGRLQHDQSRPLLQTEDPKATLAEILNTRRPLYQECAHLHIEIDNLHPEEIAYGVTESYQTYLQELSNHA